MSARQLTPILPAMTLAEALDTTRLFRASHYTISDVGLISGGQVPRLGEVSPACHGVLCLDALPEFRRRVLEGLHQPLDESVL